MYQVINKCVNVYFDAIRDMLCPPRCLECLAGLPHSRPPLLCSSCLTKIFPISSPLCICCGFPFIAGKDHLCGECLTNTFAFDLARAPFFHHGVAASLTVKLKFAGKLGTLASLATLARQSPLFSHIVKPDLIIPVPLHKKRLQERGFNQALLLAENCFPDWRDRFVVQSLLRWHPTVPQTSLKAQQRRKNLKGVFVLSMNASMVAGKTILLVDDVFTTGSTVSECSRVLKHAGAVRVEVFTMTRSVPSHYLPVQAMGQ